MLSSDTSRSKSTAEEMIAELEALRFSNIGAAADARHGLLSALCDLVNEMGRLGRVDKASWKQDGMRAYG